MMFDFMISEYEIPISEEDQQFIKALIAGDPSKCRWVLLWPCKRLTQLTHVTFMSISSDEKEFLFDIVANKRNGLDVDK